MVCFFLACPGLGFSYYFGLHECIGQLMRRRRRAAERARRHCTYVMGGRDFYPERSTIRGKRTTHAIRYVYIYNIWLGLVGDVWAGDMSKPVFPSRLALLFAFGLTMHRTDPTQGGPIRPNPIQSITQRMEIGPHPTEIDRMGPRRPALSIDQAIETPARSGDRLGTAVVSDVLPAGLGQLKGAPPPKQGHGAGRVTLPAAAAAPAVCGQCHSYLDVWERRAVCPPPA